MHLLAALQIYLDAGINLYAVTPQLWVVPFSC